MKDQISVALPKGRLGEAVYRKFDELGLGCADMLDGGRKLIFENDGIRYFWAKPSDVAIYVERGAADIGVVGRDILLEYDPDVYELSDLGMGKCRMCEAGPAGRRPDPEKTLKAATKFPNIARSYFAGMGRDVDLIHLNGSIEIAPLVGLSDVIVDIVETGITLRENGLEVYSEIVDISARLIAGKAAYRFKGSRIDEIAAGIGD